MKRAHVVKAWGRILTGYRPNLSVEITRECPLRCPGCYAYGDTHLGGDVVLRQLADFKGQALVVFVSIKPGNTPDKALAAKLGDHVAKEIGKFAKPDAIRFADALPKTRSGKIMRRFLKDVAAGRESTGDTSTIEDLGVLAKLRAEEE